MPSVCPTFESQTSWGRVHAHYLRIFEPEQRLGELLRLTSMGLSLDSVSLSVTVSKVLCFGVTYMGESRLAQDRLQYLRQPLSLVALASTSPIPR